MKSVKNLFIYITLAFPKAGLKISGFPLYLSLISSFYFMALGVKYGFSRRKESLWCIIPIISLLTTLLFNQFSFTAVFFSGASYLGIPALLAYIVSIFSFYCYYGAISLKNDHEWKKKLIYVFYFLIGYAFLQKILGDYTVVIPGVTASFQDALTPNFLAGKNNMIWGMNYLKATSTYQNGNLFGANLLLIGFAVIANYITDKKKIIVPMTLLGITVLLTASASVYLGMAAAILWMVFFSRNRNSASIIAVFFGGLFLAIIAIVILSTDNIFSQLIYERVLNRDLSAGGGRMEKINDYVEHISQTPWLLINGMLFYNKPFLEVYEILPGAILQIFGISMLVFFVAFIISKIRVFFSSPYILPFIAYFSASLSDGAFWLPPTATNVFIIMGLCTLWHKNSLPKIS
ncbi:TPA: hypothetical protein ACMEX2_004779 [Klebsiella pneumoniae]|uniref:Putative WzyC polymerase n=1 Tax=Klebsiella pneumoniae TaxID=573 RepID=A0A1C3T0M2_KLEPN|nr:hypothetical protein [Klebsiella pneumoniae]VEC52362.1 Lipid A core - O-antigen ligase and related enzymes [Klebsiella aerogenes]ELC0800811.1 hypothetical protein [Klebsiella pneumoniae]ELL9838232.1 hypothetical protein [Klebsiella pneumoniae]ELQ4794574.1 hypothetical protein [Klebsiella pneumoniae]MCP6173518.1 hypothetical protein [Klebsiella pneumoniae]